MKSFTKLIGLVFVILLAGCRKDNNEQNFQALQQDNEATTFYNKESNSVECRAYNFLEKCKPPVNDYCPTTVGTNVNRVAINGNTARYCLIAYVHNFSSHWLKWEVTGPGGTVSGIVPITTDDGSDGIPQIIDLGILCYPKDACFTLKVSGFFTRPRGTSTSCFTPFMTGVICPELFPPF